MKCSCLWSLLSVNNTEIVQSPFQMCAPYMLEHKCNVHFKYFIKESFTAGSSKSVDAP